MFWFLYLFVAMVIGGFLSVAYFYFEDDFVSAKELVEAFLFGFVCTVLLFIGLVGCYCLGHAVNLIIT